MSPWPRTIAHVDMDAFYVSVEVRDDPSLAGRAIAVGGDPTRRGVVSSASYEARKYGVRSALPMAVALRRCPHLLVIPGDMRKYRDASRALRRVFREFSPLVEPLALDEAFLDLTGTERLLGPPHAAGEAIRRRIVASLGLTASVGIAPSKFVAKLASEHDKPDGLTIVPPGAVTDFVQSLPLERLWGVGPATLEALHRADIRTIAQLARTDPDRLARRLGPGAPRLVALARGEDDRPVVPDSPAKSISHETTFATDLVDDATLEGVLLHLAELVARRARRIGTGGRTVTLKLRLGDFTTFTRSRTLAQPTRDASGVFDAARTLFRRLERRREGVRLLGVGISGLDAAPQLELAFLGEPGSRDRLHAAEDAVVARWGSGALGRARGLLGRGAGDAAWSPPSDGRDAREPDEPDDAAGAPGPGDQSPR